MIPEQSYVAWKVSMTILHAVAIVTTVIRVIQRRHTNGLWWDDHLAVIAGFMAIVQIYLLWAMFVPNKVPTTEHYWILAYSWFTLIWLCRISLALSIARIFPAWATPRRYSLGLAVCFGIIFVGILSWQATLHCVKDKAPNTFLTCRVNRESLFIFSIISDILADIFLVASPFYTLWRIRLPNGQRRLVLTLFSASALTLAVAVIFAIVTYCATGPGAVFVAAMMSQLEANVSLIVCNLLVVVTFFLRMFKKEHHDPEAIMDDKVTRHVPPVRREAAPMNVTVITLTEIAQDGTAKFQRDRDRDDNASSDGGKWSPKSNHMFNVKLSTDGN